MYRKSCIQWVALISAFLLIGGCGGGGSGPSQQSIAYSDSTKALGNAFEDNDIDKTEISSGDILKWDSERADADDDTDGRQTIDEIDVDFANKELKVDVDYDGKNIAVSNRVTLELPADLTHKNGWGMQYASRELDSSDIVGTVVISNRSKESQEDYVTAGYWYRTSSKGQFGAFATGEIEYKGSGLAVNTCLDDSDPPVLMSGCDVVDEADTERFFPGANAIKATYDGLAAGFFVGDVDAPMKSTDWFTSDITLELEESMVTGTVDNFQWGATNPTGRPTKLTLEQELEKRGTDRLNYFQGEWDDDDSGFKGQWNGRFYGEYDAEDEDSEPTSVAGTFYGNNEKKEQFIGGAFAAD